jgi:hypothetical protein
MFWGQRIRRAVRLGNFWDGHGAPDLLAWPDAVQSHNRDCRIDRTVNEFDVYRGCSIGDG